MPKGRPRQYRNPTILTVYLEEEEYQAVIAAAARQGEPVTQFVRSLCRAAVRENIGKNCKERA